MISSATESDKTLKPVPQSTKSLENEPLLILKKNI